MPFELKILDKINCPRCNGIADRRIDQHKTNTKWILVYIVCPVCKLKRYSHTTTRKQILLDRRIKKLEANYNKNTKQKKAIAARINAVRKIKSGVERSY